MQTMKRCAYVLVLRRARTSSPRLLRGEGGMRSMTDEGRRDSARVGGAHEVSHRSPGRQRTRGSLEVKDRAYARPPSAAIASRSSLTSNAPRVPLRHANNEAVCVRGADEDARPSCITRRTEQAADRWRQKGRRERIPSLFCMAERARGQGEVKRGRSQPPEAATASAVVLEFDLLSRIMAATQLMPRPRR